MSLPFLKGIEANEAESTTSNKKEDGDRNVKIKYNLCKRKHTDKEDDKEKDAANSSSKQSRTKQTENKRPRKAQQSTVLLERTQRRRTKPRNIVSIANGSSPQDDFEKLFLKKIDIHVITNSNIGINTSINGICVTNDNLIWVSYSTNHVKLFDSAGNILRSVDLEQIPVFNCCTPNGDLLFTQGYANDARAEVIMVPREGDPRPLVDLSSFAKNLCGLLCQEEMIYIVCHGKAPLKYFVIKLDMEGDVKETYRASPKNVNINHIISHYDRLYVMGTNNSCLFPLENDIISTKEKVNKVSLRDTSSASACVDNHGNVLLCSASTIYVVDESLHCVHKILTEFSSSIRTTAVDHRDQLWIGTYDGNLHAAHYISI
ncbi:uncharacterized protein LOC111107084 [Crassostrea virginica]